MAGPLLSQGRKEYFCGGKCQRAKKQKRVGDSRPRRGSNRSTGSKYPFPWFRFHAKFSAGCGRVAELADAQDLGSCGVIRAGSTPVAPTTLALT
jgi:hypothetical protein